MKEKHEGDTVQVTEPASSPNGVGSEKDIKANVVEPGSVSPEPQASPEATPEPAEDPAAAELERLAQEADQLAQPEVTPPEQEQQQPELTSEQKLDWLVSTVYNMTQQSPNGQQPQQETPPEQPGIADIYNGAFDSPEDTPAPTSSPSSLEELNALKQEVQNLRGVLAGVYESQNALQQDLQQQAQVSAQEQKINEIQNEYNLSSDDARRTYNLFSAGRYGEGMRFARGRSQVEQATDGMREQRAADRDIAGRPSIPGGTQTSPTSNNEQLQLKMQSYKDMPDGPDKDNLAVEIIAAGGMDLLRQEAMNLIRNPQVPEAVSNGIV